ncbi:TetR/AcrR family transcriptional regulator [Geodermatophilus sp. SYSU D01186]
MARTSPYAGSWEQRRARMEQTALELFRTRGFDNVTVEDVCAEAGVAPATFYRHFGTKEDVVFAYQDDFSAALRTALSDAAHLPAPARMPVILCEFAAFLESQQDLLALRDQIVLGHARLMQRTLMAQRDLEGVLAAGLAQLRGLTVPDAAALLEAGAGIVVLRVAVRSWRTEGGSLLAATRQTLTGLREMVGGLTIGDD